MPLDDAEKQCGELRRAAVADAGAVVGCLLWVHCMGCVWRAGQVIACHDSTVSLASAGQS